MASAGRERQAARWHAEGADTRAGAVSKVAESGARAMSGGESTCFHLPSSKASSSTVRPFSYAEIEASAMTLLVR